MRGFKGTTKDKVHVEQDNIKNSSWWEKDQLGDGGIQGYSAFQATGRCKQLKFERLKFMIFFGGGGAYKNFGKYFLGSL